VTADLWVELARAFGFIIFVFGVVPLAILAAFYAGERHGAQRRGSAGFDRHAEDAIRLVREWS